MAMLARLFVRFFGATVDDFPPLGDAPFWQGSSGDWFSADDENFGN